MRIEGSVSVVTGGASGLGEAVVRLFHSLGGKIAIWDMSEELGTKISSELGSSVIFCKVDVTSEDSVKAALKESTTRLGNVSVLLNCAGINIFAPTESQQLADYERVIRVNLIGTFNVSRIVAKHIAEQKSPATKEEGFKEQGVIIHVSSICGFEGSKGQTAYSSSKGGILGITLPMARDLANYGIRVNSVAPGLFGPTRMTEHLDRNALQAMMSVCPIKRWGDPKEFAHAVKFLVENTYMNGTALIIDGGMRLPNI